MFDALRRLRRVELEVELHARDHQWKAHTEVDNADLVARITALEKLMAKMLTTRLAVPLPDDKPATGTDAAGGSYV